MRESRLAPHQEGNMPGLHRNEPQKDAPIAHYCGEKMHGRVSFSQLSVKIRQSS
jgi:hypothetical protein